jgi:hypothetical protein
MKELRSSCSTLPLPKRITISLAEQDTRRLSTGVSVVPKPNTPLTGRNLATEAKRSSLNAGKREAEGEIYHRRPSDMQDDLPLWPQSRGTSPVMLEHLEQVEKESIRRQFGKSPGGKEPGLLYTLSKSPKGSFMRSPRAQTRYEPPAEDLRGFEVVPPALNLSEIEKKDNQSESLEKISHKDSEEDWSS